MADGTDRAVRAHIGGRVQGVWYRGWTVRRATQLGLRGWVRNRADGSVEALFAGPPAAVDRMLAECRDGPPAARVDAVTVEPAADPGPGPFAQRPTV
ncbi:acylphosphatase [Azospirillum sp. ST 5-10]|uniref:acylphosphatase n=1 Tax=unclassified Azospirillum TaxID=2630922 RepID=UPI003F49D2A4